MVDVDACTASFSMEIIFQCLWIEMANLNTGQKFLIPTQVDELLALRISVGCRFDRLLLSRQQVEERKKERERALLF